MTIELTVIFFSLYFLRSSTVISRAFRIHTDGDGDSAAAAASSAV